MKRLGLSPICCFLKNISQKCSQLLTVTVLLALFSGVPSQAQFRSTQWTADLGLPQNIIRGILQTPDGYLWIATLNGVARFDGVRFTIFNKSNTPGITVNRFAAMVEGAPGDLWFYCDGGAVIRFHGGSFSTLGPREGVPENKVYGITADGHGGVWIVRDQTILEWKEADGRFEPIENDGIPYRPLNWDGTGFWGYRGQTLYCFHHGRLSVYHVPDILRMEDVRKVCRGTKRRPVAESVRRTGGTIL